MTVDLATAGVIISIIAAVAAVFWWRDRDIQRIYIALSAKADRAAIEELKVDLNTNTMAMGELRQEIFKTRETIAVILERQKQLDRRKDE